MQHITITWNDLSEKERELVRLAKNAAEQSWSKSGNKVGVVISCDDGRVFEGATIGRSRVIGSTCAERMAVDQMVFHGFPKPILVVCTALLGGQDESTVAFPCGPCRQMYQEILAESELEDLEFILVSWNQSVVIKIKHTELFPCGQAYYVPSQQKVQVV